MPALSGLIGLTLYHPFVPVADRHTKRTAGGYGAVCAGAGEGPSTDMGCELLDPTRSWARMTGSDSNVLLRVGRGPSGWTLAVRIRCVAAPGRGTIPSRRNWGVWSSGTGRLGRRRRWSGCGSRPSPRRLPDTA